MSTTLPAGSAEPGSAESSNEARVSVGTALTLYKLMVATALAEREEELDAKSSTLISLFGLARQLGFACAGVVGIVAGGTVGVQVHVVAGMLVMVIVTLPLLVVVNLVIQRGELAFWERLAARMRARSQSDHGDVGDVDCSRY